MKEQPKTVHIHDYENAIRLGRAHYICPECREDITLDLVFMADRGIFLEPKESK